MTPNPEKGTPRKYNRYARVRVAPLLQSGYRGILLIDIETRMSARMRPALAKIFMHGRSEAVRQPQEYGLLGERVRDKRVGTEVSRERILNDIDAWFAEMDRFADVPFMEEGREQPPMPDEKFLLE